MQKAEEDGYITTKAMSDILKPIEFELEELDLHYMSSKNRMMSLEKRPDAVYGMIKEEKVMSREELFAAFEELFPDWAKRATSYKKIGSKCLAIRFNNGTSRVFLFENPNNWHFGTKLWRKRPDEAEKKKEIKERNNGGEKDTPIQP